MPLTWDAPLVSAVARELEDSLRDARLRGLRLDRGSRRALLFFRERTLALDLHPARGTLVLGPARPPGPGARPLPCRVERVLAPPDERLLLIEMRRARGRRLPYLLAVELMTNQWNAVLAEGDERTVRALLRERSGARPLAVGSPWAPPPPSEREGKDGRLDLDRWLELLAEVDPSGRRAELLRRVAWTSSLNAGALLGEAALETGGTAREALERGHALWIRLAGLSRAEAGGAVEPVLLEGGQPYPLALPGTAAEPAPSLLEALSGAAAGTGEAAGTGDAPALATAWTAAAEARVRRARRRVRSLERRWAAAPDPEALRGVGDLILARYAEVPAGVTEVTLDDFEGRAVRVELDPALPPHENAAAYYRRASRAERARERLPGLVAEARAGLARAQGLLERVERGELDREQLLAALPEAVEGNAAAGKAPTLPYRRYRSSGGLEIRVGRSARTNDLLTFRHSARDDVWMHARHAAGAHVILRWTHEGNPPARDLAEAAVLAALFSRARSSGSVPVDWTRRKYVRKPRKAPPGAVVIERVRTLFVEPDPAVAERLRVEDGEGEPDDGGAEYQARR